MKSDQESDKIHKGLLGRVSDVTKTILHARRAHRSGQFSRSYRGSRRKELSIGDPEPRFNSVMMAGSHPKSLDTLIDTNSTESKQSVRLPFVTSPQTPDIVIPEIQSPGIQSLMMEDAIDELLNDGGKHASQAETNRTVTENTKSIENPGPIILELPEIEPVQEGPLTLADSLEHAFRAISMSFDSSLHTEEMFNGVSNQTNRVPSSVYESSSIKTNSTHKIASRDSVISTGYTDSDKVVADESSLSSNDTPGWLSYQTQSEDFVFEDCFPTKSKANFYQQHTEAIMRDMELQKRVRDSFYRKREELRGHTDKCNTPSPTGSPKISLGNSKGSGAASANIIRGIQDVHDTVVHRHTESRQRSNLASEIRGLPRFISVHAGATNKV